MSESTNVQKATYTRHEAGAVIGVSMTTLDALLKRKENPIPSVRIGRKVLIPIEKLHMWIAENTNC